MFNVGVIGLGMGRAHLQAYSTIAGVSIAAISDLDEGRLEACRAQYSVPAAHADYRKLLAMDSLDLVSVCLPNYLHAPVTLEALAAGRHVLVEKPMAMSVAEARSMAAAAAQHGRTLAVAVNYRWAMGPDTWYLKDLVGRGCLGTLYYVKAVSLRRRTFMPGHVTWFSDRKRSGGGGLIDMGPHMLDLSMWLLDDYAPTQVSGVTRTAIMTDTDVDDLASGLVRMRGGAAIALESTWASFTRPGLSITLMGTQGGAVLDLGAPQGQRLTVYGADQGTLTEWRPVDIRLPEPPQASVQEHVVECIRSGRPPQNSAERGIAVMQILEGLYQSSATQREVTVA